jgi:hypothetical protein
VSSDQDRTQVEIALAAQNIADYSASLQGHGSGRAMKRDIGRALADSLARSRADEEDKRCLRGRYAPEHGWCRVCETMTVVANIAFTSTGRIGGPPGSAYVAGYYCERCGIRYHFASRPET